MFYEVGVGVLIIGKNKSNDKSQINESSFLVIYRQTDIDIHIIFFANQTGFREWNSVDATSIHRSVFPSWTESQIMETVVQNKTEVKFQI